jgi:hypothetical protein
MPGRDRLLEYWENFEDLSKKEKKFLDKTIKKYRRHLIDRLSRKYNYLVYQLDDDIFQDKEKEEYYTKLLDTIYKNYKTIVPNDPNFFVCVSKQSISIKLNDNKEYTEIVIRPFSINTETRKLETIFEFETKKNLYKKYIKKYTEIEFFIEKFYTSTSVDKFKLRNKLDREDNLEKLLS